MSAHDFGVKGLRGYLDSVDEKIRQQASAHIGGVRRLLEASGKRWRPSLVIAVVCHSGKKIDEDAINAAAAVELIHLSSLVHDDIMDGGTFRHGIPTINAEEGEDSAILAGDYLLAKGCSLAASVSGEAGRVLSETVADLCDGQAKELSDQFNVKRTTESLLGAIRGKTSSMFIVSLTLGGLVSGLNARQLKALSDFGLNYGIAYQYADDVKDFAESFESTGKSVGNDVLEGNYTFPVILSLKGPNGLALKKLLGSKEVSAQKVYEILKQDGSLELALKEAEGYKQKAIASLASLDNAELAKALEQSANYF